MIKNKTNLLFSILALLYVVVLFFTFYYLLPGVKKYSDICIRTQNNIATSRDILSQSSVIKNSYVKIQNDIQKANNLFADKEAPLVFIGFLEGLAKETHLNIEIYPANSEGKYVFEPSEHFGLQPVLTGQSSDIKKFIEKIENSPYLISIQDLNIARVINADSKMSEAKAIITLRVYAKK